MFESFIYALPELILICGLLLLPIIDFFEYSPRQIFKICTWVLVLSLSMDIIFYNKSYSEHYFVSTGFSTLISSIVYLSSIAILILARRWYAATGEKPLTFCLCVILNLLLCNVFTQSIHFAVTVVAFWGLLGINFMLLKHSSGIKDVGSGLKLYSISAVVFACVMLFSAFMLYLDNGHLAYSSLKDYISAKHNSVELFILMSTIALCYVFLIGLAPLNFWKTEVQGQVILPIAAYFLLVPFAAYFASFINLMHFVFGVYLENISVFCIIFGAVSIFIGAFGACSAMNIHKILAYGSLFHLGVMTLALNSLNVGAINNFLFYLLIYMLSMFGIMSAFFGLKNKGEYLQTLGETAGCCTKKPYISAMITVYLFSLIGFPPFLGFIGLYAVGLNLAYYNHYYIILFLLAMLVVLAYAHMQIIKNMYFEKSNNSYDHTERVIYAFLFFNALIMVVIGFKPDILVDNIKMVTENLFG